MKWELREWDIAHSGCRTSTKKNKKICMQMGFKRFDKKLHSWLSLWTCEQKNLSLNMLFDRLQMQMMALTTSKASMGKYQKFASLTSTGTIFSPKYGEFGKDKVITTRIFHFISFDWIVYTLLWEWDRAPKTFRHY